MSVSEDEVEGSSSIVDGIRWTQAELEPFCGVLVALATPLLLPQDADALYASLHTHKAVTLINRFLSDSATTALFLEHVKPRSGSEDLNGAAAADGGSAAASSSTASSSGTPKSPDGNSDADVEFRLSLCANFSSNTAPAGTLVLVKTAETLNLDPADTVSLFSQLTVFSWPGNPDPVEAVKALVQNGISPLLNAYLLSNISPDNVVSSSGISNLDTSLMDLVDALDRCQEPEDVPPVDLLEVAHPKLKELRDQLSAADKEFDIPSELARNRVFQAECSDLIQSKWMERVKRVTRAKPKGHFRTVSRIKEYWISVREEMANICRQLQIPILQKHKSAALDLPVNTNAKNFDSEIQAGTRRANLFCEFLEKLRWEVVDEVGHVQQLDSQDMYKETINPIISKATKAGNVQQEEVFQFWMSLLEALSRGLENLIIRSFHPFHLLDLTYEKFNEVMEQLTDQESNKFYPRSYRDLLHSYETSVCMHLRKDGAGPVEHSIHFGIVDRLRSIMEFREEHHKLWTSARKILGGWRNQGIDVGLVDKLDAIYEKFADSIKSVLFKVDSSGEQQYRHHKEVYDRSIAEFKRSLLKNINARLSRYKSFYEKFRLFSEASRMLGIHEFGTTQATLYDQLGKRVDRLEESFRDPTQDTSSVRLGRHKYLTSIVARTHRNRQFLRQTHLLLEQVNAICGNELEQLASITNADGHVPCDESLARLLGTSLAKLQDLVESTSMLQRKRDLVGNALVVSWLRTRISQVRNIESTVRPFLTPCEESLISRSSNPTELEELGHEAGAIIRQIISNDQGHTELWDRTRGRLSVLAEEIQKKISEDISKWCRTLEDTKQYALWGIQENKVHGSSSYILPGSLVRVIRMVPEGGSGSTAAPPAESGSLHLAINFSPRLVEIVREFQQLTDLLGGPPKNVPHKLLLVMAREAPIATSLQACFNSFHKLVQVLNNDDMILLAADQVESVMECVGALCASGWETMGGGSHAEDPSSEPLIRSSSSRKLLDNLQNLQSSVQRFHGLRQKLRKIYHELETCPYLVSRKDAVGESGSASFAAKHGKSLYSPLSKPLESLQQVMADIVRFSWPNTEQWIAYEQQKVKKVLAKRLEEALKAWCLEFRMLDPLEQNSVDEGSRAEAVEATHIMGTPLHPFNIDLKLKSRTMTAQPSLEHARRFWLDELQRCIMVVADLEKPRFGHSKYLKDTFRDVVLMLPSTLLTECLDVVESKIFEAQGYINQWLRFQSLWDLDPAVVFGTLGDDFVKWEQLLVNFLEARSVVAASGTVQAFGAIDVCYQDVQEEIHNQYDSWNTSLFEHYADLMKSSTEKFYENVEAGKQQLENAAFDMNYSDTVASLTALSRLRRDKKKWKKQLEHFKRADVSLRKHHHGERKWLALANLIGSWDAFRDILKRKTEEMAASKEELESEVRHDEDACVVELEGCEREWRELEDAQGISPAVVLQNMDHFQKRVDKLRERMDRIRSAKEALDMEVGTFGEGMQSLVKNMALSRSRWETLVDLHQDLLDIRSIVIRSGIQSGDGGSASDKVRTRLNQLHEKMKHTVTGEHAQFAPLAKFRDKVMGYRRIHNSIMDPLCGRAFKTRHWHLLFEKLGKPEPSHLDRITVGDVYDLNPEANDAIFKEVLRVAQGEFALETFFEEINQRWKSYDLLVEDHLIDFHRKCKLIRRWEEILSKINDDINMLVSMRLSPFFKEFVQKNRKWEDRLNNIRVVSDIWIDVQRRYVYLEGIFTSNEDIRVKLPSESERFNSVERSFVHLMREVEARPQLLTIMDISELESQLEKFADSLKKIQKRLGAYLEEQRSHFARLYFIGDEDLLEILGHSKDPVKVSKHLKKMFPGIAGFVLNESGNAIVGVSSAEGEEILFQGSSTPEISVAKDPVTLWLAKVAEATRLRLAELTGSAVEQLGHLWFSPEGPPSADNIVDWVNVTPGQCVILAAQVVWTHQVQVALEAVEVSKSSSKQLNPDRFSLDGVAERVDLMLGILADSVLQEQRHMQRKKYEHLITELVHQRDVVRQLMAKKVDSPKDFAWLYYMRFYWSKAEPQADHRLIVRVANAEFLYGFEYLGMVERLVQTPLTDRCFLTLTQALAARLGGSPFGPAGTGKTETVKALGAQLGRFVLVFNCDENFDFKAMGRIFLGLCMCGAWGCFDEFNRLEERILSAVSQEIHSIQMALRDKSFETRLINRRIHVSPDTGIFVTMNPGYAGRKNLPDNLKQLFRSIAMVKPDRELIAQVMLFSQGFRTAEFLARKIVPLFELCADQLSHQSHYDFGLRALKSVLVSAGGMKRGVLMSSAPKKSGTTSIEDEESNILIRSVVDNVVPKLVADDLPLLRSLLMDVFPGREIPDNVDEVLETHLVQVCQENGFVQGDLWMEKMKQLHRIQKINHGLMMVGPSGSGKTTSRIVLLRAMERAFGIQIKEHRLDAKAMSKDELYGVLDPTNREWTDGVFTRLLRDIQAADAEYHDSTLYHWIIFDGDVDPEWVENLNSLLDDNKLLTLPNGERLSLLANIRIAFEVENLKYATLATVSRCGMVWYSSDVISPDMVLSHYLERLRSHPLSTLASDTYMMEPSSAFGDDRKGTGPSLDGASSSRGQQRSQDRSPEQKLQDDAFSILKPLFQKGGFVLQALEASRKLSDSHVMDFTDLRVLNSFLSLMTCAILEALRFSTEELRMPMDHEHLRRYISRKVVLCCAWGFGGSLSHKSREELAAAIHSIGAHCDVELPPGSLFEYEATVQDGLWMPFSARVQSISVDPEKIIATDVVVPTLDTVRHESIMGSWITSHKPVLLCGPPGSGKTMTLTAVLKHHSEFQIEFLNFSKTTTPDLILKTIDQHCEYYKSAKGHMVAPKDRDRWLILFCDEINLPAEDNYGTQRVISFLRQLIEHGGFWRSSDNVWIQVERIQFVGACNPPTDPGRVPLSHRFLCHTPLLYVDFPSPDSLVQIYRTFSRALISWFPDLQFVADSTAEAMVELYVKSQERFTPDQQAHYIYSPRELSRWVRALFEGVQNKIHYGISLENFVRLWVHEGLRLFQDRLVSQDERDWTDRTIDEIARRHFPSADPHCLARPILFSDWLDDDYRSVDREELRNYVQARLKEFADEELEVELVVFDSVLDHVIRIDRVLNQPLGHLLLVGTSGAGKTVLSRFVAWTNGLSVFQIQAHKKYSGEDFRRDLREVMKRAGCRSERICFIFDESNVLESSFLEYMNALLASGEVPGLFEGEELHRLFAAIRESSGATPAEQRLIEMMDSDEDLYKYFTQQVQKNLHVVFTMNPAGSEFSSRTATSPALFNRCVVDWFGDWSEHALRQVGEEFTRFVQFPPGLEQETLSESMVGYLVNVHRTAMVASDRAAQKSGTKNFITPRHYLDMIQHFQRVYTEKREKLREQKLHLNGGLQKLSETADTVAKMRVNLQAKQEELNRKNAEANGKLNQMMADSKQAEEKKKGALELAEELREKQVVIEEQGGQARQDLARAEPALREAQEAVKGIRQDQLREIRTLNNPPPKISLALSAVLACLEPDSAKAPEWGTIKAIISKPQFISQLAEYNPEEHSLTEQQRARIKSNFLDNPDFTYKIINHASRACGPMVKWVTAVVEYSEILERVAPLQEEVRKLEVAAVEVEERQQAYEQMVADLEAKISLYKQEYEVLVEEASALKKEMTQVQKNMERSISLMQSLQEEQDRWIHQNESFEEQIRTTLGDALLSGAFLAYIGCFDWHFRHNVLLPQWQMYLDNASIPYTADFKLVETLASPGQRLTWQSNSLPSDDLCEENAVILDRFNRYPLIVDPSGQGTTFLMNQLSGQKISKCSFLDPNFRQSLASALRFGNSLLIQDVEYFDPILNPVLNKEYSKAGGRVLIKLPGEDIDFSPTFKCYLATRDPTCQFPPDVCSRVTFVNFTVTPSSMQSQAMSRVLKAVRPDVDEQHRAMLHAQGRFSVELRQLQDKLLSALAESVGSILENEVLITTLEHLKRDSSEIEAKMRETESVMEEINASSSLFQPLAISCSRLFFALEQAPDLHFLYQFSLEFFFRILDEILLRINQSMSGASPVEKADALRELVFVEVFRKVTDGMLQRDELAMALRFAQIRMMDSEMEQPEEHVDFLLKGPKVLSKAAMANISLPAGLEMTPVQKQAAVSLAKVKGFENLLENFQQEPDQWVRFLQEPMAERVVPSFFDSIEASSGRRPASDKAALVTSEFRKTLALRAFRLDRVALGAASLISAVFGPEFLAQEVLDLRSIVENDSDAYTPVMICCTPGYEASSAVFDLAAARHVRLHNVAMGSPESFDSAEGVLSHAQKAGDWVLLENVHLAPRWLAELEKRIHSLQLENGIQNNAFRLFLAAEIHPDLPPSLLSRSRLLVFEQPPGVKANLLHTFSVVSTASRLEKPPAERSRMHMLLAWLHAVIQERLIFAPLGWSKRYEFNESDLRFAFDTVDQWMESAAGNMKNIPVQQIPWEALRTLLEECVYGGRVDNEFDMRLLSGLLAKYLHRGAFSFEFHLATLPSEPGSTGIQQPEHFAHEDMLQWVRQLPDEETPEWVGLPLGAKRMLLETQAEATLSGVLKLQSLYVVESAYEASKLAEMSSSTAVSPMASAFQGAISVVTEWLRELPESMTRLERTAANMEDPLFRCFVREVDSAVALLRTVRQDLHQLVRVCRGESKQTNLTRDLLLCVQKDVIPSHWRRYTVPRDMSLSVWIPDLCLRLRQLVEIAASSDFCREGLALGRLLFPGAFITATRQSVAHALHCSLETLRLQLSVTRPSGGPPPFGLDGLVLEGAQLSLESGSLSTSTIGQGSSESQHELPRLFLQWVVDPQSGDHTGNKSSSAAGSSASSSSSTTRRSVSLPLYLNSTRLDLITTVDLPIDADTTPQFWFERGAAMLAWNPSLLH